MNQVGFNNYFNFLSEQMNSSTNRGTEVDIVKILEKLLSVKGSKPGKQVNLLESEIQGLVTKAREVFISEPILLGLEGPLKICGTGINSILHFLKVL